MIKAFRSVGVCLSVCLWLSLFSRKEWVKLTCSASRASPHLTRQELSLKALSFFPWLLKICSLKYLSIIVTQGREKWALSQQYHKNEVCVEENMTTKVFTKLCPMPLICYNVFTYVCTTYRHKSQWGVLEFDRWPCQAWVLPCARTDHRVSCWVFLWVFVCVSWLCRHVQPQVRARSGWGEQLSSPVWSRLYISAADRTGASCLLVLGGKVNIVQLLSGVRLQFLSRRSLSLMCSGMFLCCSAVDDADGVGNVNET